MQTGDKRDDLFKFRFLFYFYLTFLFFSILFFSFGRAEAYRVYRVFGLTNGVLGRREGRRRRRRITFVSFEFFFLVFIELFLFPF